MVSIKALKWIAKRIGLVKLKGIARLRFNIYPHNLKSSKMIPHTSSTTSAV